MAKVKYYNSIDDLPCLKYHQVTENSDLKYLTIEGEPTDAELFNAWELITDQVIEQHLKNPEYIEGLKKEQRYLIKQINAEVGNSLAAKLIAENEKDLLEQKLDANTDFFEIISIMSQNLYPCNPNELSTRMYLTNLSRLTKQNKTQNKAQK